MKAAAYTHLQLMDPKLEFKYLRLEKSRNLLLDELEGFDDDLLNIPAALGKWSINQIIYHLIKVDSLTAGYISNKVKLKEPLAPVSLPGSVRSFLLKIALQSGKRFKAPAAVAETPETCNLSDLRREWDEVRFKLEDVLTEIPAELINKFIFKFPAAGPLTASQTLTFLQDHFDHHLRQIHQLKVSLLK